MKYIVLILILLIPNNLISKSYTDEYWYLNYSKEAPLQKIAKNSDETYRLFIIPLGYVSHVIRIELIKDKYRLYYKRGKSSGKSPQFTETVKPLTKNQWQDFIALLNQASFWLLPSLEYDKLGMDGITYILEGAKSNQYHFVKRWSPKEESFLKTCKYLGNLAQ